MWPHALKILIKEKKIKQKQTWDSKDTFVSLLKHKSAIYSSFSFIHFISVFQSDFALLL